MADYFTWADFEKFIARIVKRYPDDPDIQKLMNIAGMTTEGGKVEMDEA